MSTEIEREVVQMIFDAKQFHKGVESSIKDIDSLKKSFDFRGAQTSMAQLNKMGSQDHFGPMARSLDALNSKVSLMGTIAATAVSRLTNAVIDGSKQLFNTLILTPIKTGLEEYETQLNAVQTILANTKKDGTTLEYVNEKLDELNTYADLTIYNFTQMTDSIGKFTAAGVDIDTSVASIKGIANVAALSGSNAQQASTAMYQLSQAMASGTVRLQDWMSVENAGMGGAVFQDALIESARVHGIAVDQMIEQNGSFRLSLQEGWLSSDLMAETLQKFTGDLTAEQLLSMGYTEQQIEGIMEMATAANDAATKIKTLTQLKDTMAEAMQSGWGQTWRIVFGDFEQAKVMWGNIAGVFGTIIDNSSQARNSLLEMWAATGGRVALVDGFMNLIQAIINVLGAFGETIREVFEPLTYVDLFQITFAFLNFSKRLLEASNHLDPFKKIVKAVASILWILREVITKIGSELGHFIRQTSSSAGGILDFVLNIADAIIAFRDWAEETDHIDMVIESVFGRIGKFITKVKELVKQFSELKVIQDVTRYLKGLESDDFIRVWDVMLKLFRAIVTPIIAVAVAIASLVRVIAGLEIFKVIGGYFKEIDFTGIKNGFRDIAQKIRDVIDSVKGHEVLTAFGDFFRTFDGRRFTAFVDNAKSSLGGFVEALKGLNKQSEETPDNIDAMGDSVVENNSKISQGLTDALTQLTENAGSLDYSKIFAAINAGMFGGLVLAIKKVLDMGLLGGILGSEIGEGVSDSLEGLTGALEGMESNLKAQALKSIAVAIALLAGSLILLTLVDTNKLLIATTAMVTFTTALFGAAGALKKIDVGSATKATIVMGGIAASMIILAIALKAVDGLSSENIEQNIAVMVAGIASLVVATQGLAKGSGGDAGAAKSVALMLGLSTSLYLLLGVIKRFGELEPEVLAQGIAGIAGSLAVLIGAIVAITRFSGGSLIKAGISISEMAFSLIILRGAVKQFGEMDMDVMTKGLKAIAIVLGGFSIASRLLSEGKLIEAGISLIFIALSMKILAGAVESFGILEWGEIQRGLLAMAGALLIITIAGRALTTALPGAVAIFVMSTALLIMAGALKLLASIPFDALLLGLLGIALTFALLGVAAAILAPLVPVLLVFGLAIAAMGLAALAFGAGISLAATALLGLVGVGAAVGATILAIGAAVAQVLPIIAEALGSAIVAFLTVIAEKTPEIINAMGAIILGMIEAIWGLIPDIVAVILEMITSLLQAIADRLPDLIQAGYDILIGFLTGIKDNIAEVIATGLQIVAEIINGIAEGLPDLIDAAFNLLETFLQGIADAIEEHMPRIIELGIEIGANMVAGVIKGLLDGLSGVVQAAKDLAQAAVDAWNNLWDNRSPSHLMQKIAGYIVAGFVVGIKHNTSKAVDAMIELGKKTQNGISFLEEALLYGMDNAFDYNPVITPVLNLDELNAGAKGIKSLFGGSQALASLATEGTLDSAVIPAGQTAAMGVGGVIYNQYNYSPKALDQATIYRKTKTHVARLKEKEFGL